MGITGGPVGEEPGDLLGAGGSAGSGGVWLAHNLELCTVTQGGCGRKGEHISCAVTQRGVRPDQSL